MRPDRDRTRGTTTSDGDDPYDFPEDPRYAVSVRELKLCLWYWVLTTAGVVGVAWWLGAGRSGAEMDLILGFPEWFFWSGLGGGLVMSVAPYFLITRYFESVSLEADDPAEQVEEK